MKPRKLVAPQLTRWAREITGNMGVVEASAPALSKVNDYIDTAISGADYSAIRRGGSEGSAPERAVMAGRTDDVGKNATTLVELLERIRKDSYRVRELIPKLMVDWDDPEKRAAASFIADASNAPGASSDRCGNCSRVVAGTPNDRMRSGRCQECWRFKQRHKGTERPRDLWDVRQCSATYTDMTAGVERECTLPEHGDEVAHHWERMEESA